MFAFLFSTACTVRFLCKVLDIAEAHEPGRLAVFPSGRDCPPAPPPSVPCSIGILAEVLSVNFRSGNCTLDLVVWPASVIYLRNRPVPDGSCQLSLKESVAFALLLKSPPKARLMAAIQEPVPSALRVSLRIALRASIAVRCIRHTAALRICSCMCARAVS